MTIWQLIKSISKKEWRFLIVMILVVIVITSGPYLFGWLNAPKDSYYLGMSILSPADPPVYYSWFNQVKEGRLIFKNLFTSGPQTAVIVNSYWLFPGFLAKFFKISAPLAYQIARILTIPFLIITLYILISYIFPEFLKRKVTLTFMLFASGISGLFAPEFYKGSFEINGYFYLPADLWVSESNIFLTMLHSGHFIASLTLLVLIFLLILIFLESKKISQIVLAGVLALILFSFHLYTAPLIFMVLGIFWLASSFINKKINWRFFKSLVIFGLISLPLFFYYWLVLLFDPLMIQKAIQNISLTPAWYLNIFSYGFLLIFGLLGLILFFKNKEYQDSKKLFLAVWLIVQFVIIYLPFNFQRRIMEGLQIPLVFFTVAALFFIYRKLKIKLSQKTFNFWVKNPMILIFLFFILFCFTNFLVWFSNFYYYFYDDGYFYWPKDEILAMKYLNQLPDDIVILSGSVAGNFIPAFSDRTVFLGHKVETLFFDSKRLLVTWFFETNNQDEQKIKFLKDNNITHLYYGGLERVGGEFNPEAKSYLKKIYQQGEVVIYQVID